MQNPSRKHPRILVVTPEVASLPAALGERADTVVAKAGGLADVSATLIEALVAVGSDVHVAIPHYRELFRKAASRRAGGLRPDGDDRPGGDRIHLAEDGTFLSRTSVYGNRDGDAVRLALAFQRELTNRIIPVVQPDLIHCHDWMTGLVPAAAQLLGIPCLLTVHNIHTYELTLAAIEEGGIEASRFWRNLYYTSFPQDYEQTRTQNRVDLLASGIHAASFVNTVSPRFLEEVVSGYHAFVPNGVRRELRNKVDAGCARGILNAPPEDFDPIADRHLAARYSAADHAPAKRTNKRYFQERVGLDPNDSCPLVFWPSRLDVIQKGCDIFSEIIREIVTSYSEDGLQIAFVADGPGKGWFHDISRRYNLAGRVAIVDFSEELSHLGYAAADFIMMPSKFEPCGLPQMIGALYGSLPVVHNTGGLHDTVTALSVAGNCGNGFIFDTYNCSGLRACIAQALDFHRLPAPLKQRQIARVMDEARERFRYSTMTAEYLHLYEEILGRPLGPGEEGPGVRNHRLESQG